MNHVGPTGAGQVTKAANQIVVALTIEAVSEALVLGSKGGVPPETVLDVLSGGLAGNKVMEVKREKFLSRFPLGAAPQGPRDSARGGQGVRCGAARDGDRGSDAPDDEEEGLGRRGPLRALEGHRGSLAAYDSGLERKREA